MFAGLCRLEAERRVGTSGVEDRREGFRGLSAVGLWEGDCLTGRGEGASLGSAGFL